MVLHRSRRAFVLKVLNRHFVASLVVLDAERRAPPSTPSDRAVVGDDDGHDGGVGRPLPVTAAARFVAGGLMLARIALLGVVTAPPASWLIDRVAEVEEESQAATRRDVEGLTREIGALRDEIARLRS